MLRFLTAHTYSGIFHFDTEVDSVVSGNGIYMNIDTAFLGIFQSIGNEVPHYFFEFGNIGGHHGWTSGSYIYDEFKIFRLKICHLGNNIIYYGRKHVLFCINSQLFHFYLGIIKNITDLLRNTLTRTFNGTQIFLNIRIIFFFYADVRKANNCVDGGSELV